MAAKYYKKKQKKTTKKNKNFQNLSEEETAQKGSIC